MAEGLFTSEGCTKTSSCLVGSLKKNYYITMIARVKIAWMNKLAHNRPILTSWYRHTESIFSPSSA